MQKPETFATAVDIQAADQLIGTIIGGRYKIHSLLGVGAMAAVYLAHHVVIQKRMAVKVLHPSLLTVPEIIARFEREAMAAAHLEHPNVVNAYDFGRTDNGGFFLALDFIDGKELSSVLKAGPMPAPRALAIARQITSALCTANERNIIHRGLNPQARTAI
jgi:serine/threonine-protein kinase